MNLKDKVIVGTGGANGIGAALCRRFAQKSSHVVIADLEILAGAWANSRTLRL